MAKKNSRKDSQKVSKKEGETQERLKVSHMRLTSEVDHLETQIDQLKKIVANHKELIDFMYVQLQARGILSYVMQSSAPVRVPLAPSSEFPQGPPSQCFPPFNIKVNKTPKEAPRTIKKNDAF